MAVTVALLAGGTALLYLGAEGAVRGAGSLARLLRVSPFALGALVFGTDLESLGATVVASGRGETQIAAGEAFGTILFLFGPALGIALLLARGPVPSPPPRMVALPAIPVAFCATVIADRFVARWEGALLVATYAAYLMIVWAESTARRLDREEAGGDPEAEPVGGPALPVPPVALRQRSPHRGAALLAGGIGLLYVGGWVVVGGASRLVALTPLSAGFVGAVVLGFLTSLDELLLEALPIRRGEPDLATGNLFGTLAAFTTGALGIAALVRPMDLDSAANLAFLAVAALYALVGTTFLLRGRAGRGLGVAVLAAYAVWVAITALV